MKDPGTDRDVALLRQQLDDLALACLEFLHNKESELAEIERRKFRNAARAALQRSIELPVLLRQDREAWIERTMKFLNAVSRLLIQYMDINLE